MWHPLDVTSRFVLGVDLDGVVADYTVGFREVVAADRGVDPESLSLERGWDFEEWGFEPGDFERYHRQAVNEQRILANLPVVDGAADALWRLSDAGIWLRVITHRLYVNWGHAVAVADTVTWLDENQIPYRDICFLGDKPEVEADTYIDDAPHNISALRAAGNDVIVFDQPYNRDAAHPRAHSWPEVEELVLGRYADRRGELGVQPQLPGVDPGADRLDRRSQDSPITFGSQSSG